MAPHNFSWVIADRLAGCAMPGGGSDNPDRIRCDLRALFDSGVRVLVSLERTPRAFPALCRASGIESWVFVLPDFSVPAHDESFTHLVERIISAVDTGRAVCVHCRAGIGRTGLLLACVMKSYFLLDAQQAIQSIRAVRPAIETHEQEAFVHRFSTVTPRQDLP